MRLYIALVSCLLLAAGFSSTSNAAEKHLIYMQGCCSVKQTNGPVAKGYQTIAQKLRDDGFDVFFELRTSDETDSDAQVQAYATKVAEYVQGLLLKGTAPEDITVSGFSLGSVTTMVASGLIANQKVNYVLLAGCPEHPHLSITIDYTKVKGRVLSIVNNKDRIFGSCAGHFPNTATFKEITLDSGEGHKLFRLTDESSLKLWKEPLENWAMGQSVAVQQ